MFDAENLREGIYSPEIKHLANAIAQDLQNAIQDLKTTMKEDMDHVIREITSRQFYITSVGNDGLVVGSREAGSTVESGPSPDGSSNL